jgi:hypothetical protein
MGSLAFCVVPRIFLQVGESVVGLEYQLLFTLEHADRQYVLPPETTASAPGFLVTVLHLVFAACLDAAVLVAVANATN